MAMCGVCRRRTLIEHTFTVDGREVRLGRCRDCDVRQCHANANPSSPSGCSAKVPNPALNARCTAGHVVP